MGFDEILKDSGVTEWFRKEEGSVTRIFTWDKYFHYDQISTLSKHTFFKGLSTEQGYLVIHFIKN